MVDKIGHSVDGIEEYDNPVPRWLMIFLYGTIIFSVGYLVIYPGFWAGTSGWTQAQMYEEEMAAAEKKYASIKNKPVNTAALVGDAGAIDEGKTIFAQSDGRSHLRISTVCSRTNRETSLGLLRWSLA